MICDRVHGWGQVPKGRQERGQRRVWMSNGRHSLDIRGEGFMEVGQKELHLPPLYLSWVLSTFC